MIVEFLMRFSCKENKILNDGTPLEDEYVYIEDCRNRNILCTTIQLMTKKLLFLGYGIKDSVAYAL
jgi:hypothetical protein